MWLEAGVGILLLLALAQSALLFHGWRQLRELQRQVAALSHDAIHAGTDVPTSMLVTALGRLERQVAGSNSNRRRPGNPTNWPSNWRAKAPTWNSWSAAAACRATRRGWSCRCIRPIPEMRVPCGGRLARADHSSAAS